jgi:hypothetical protein
MTFINEMSLHTVIVTDVVNDGSISGLISNSI